MALKIEVGLIPEGGGGIFEQYYEGGTVIMAHKGYTTKSGYITFDPGVISTIKWRPTWVLASEPSRPPRGEPSSDPRNKPTELSTILILEESCKILTHTSKLVESHTKSRSNRLNQTSRSAVNLDESSSMPSVKGMDTV